MIVYMHWSKITEQWVICSPRSATHKGHVLDIRDINACDHDDEINCE